MRNTLLVLGASLRLTRLVTTDDLGLVLLRDPVEVLLERATGARRRVVLAAARDALDCPFCVGFWITLSVVLSERVAGRTAAWQALTTALSMNYVGGHVSARLD